MGHVSATSHVEAMVSVLKISRIPYIAVFKISLIKLNNPKQTLIQNCSFYRRRLRSDIRPLALLDTSVYAFKSGIFAYAWVKVKNFKNPELSKSNLKTCCMPIQC